MSLTDLKARQNIEGTKKKDEHSSIVELKNAKKKLRILSQITKAFAYGSNMEDTLNRIIKILGKSYRWKSVFLWMCGDDSNIVYTTGWYLPEFENTEFIRATKQRVFTPGEGSIGKAVLTRKPKWTGNFTHTASKARAIPARSLNLNTAFVVPLYVGKEVQGAIEFLGNKRSKSDKELMEITKILETHISHYIKKVKTDIKLLHSEERSKTLAEVAPAMVYTLNEKNIITSLNPTAEVLTGVKREHLIGKPFISIICPDDRTHVKHLLDEQRNSGGEVFLEANIEKQGDEDLVGEVMEKTIQHQDGTIERIGIVRDVTERYYMEKQKDLWMGIATHELKTPLTGVKAFTQIMTQKAKKLELEEFVEYLDKINTLTDDMSDLVNDLLDVTKIKSGGLEINTQKINIKDVVKKVISTIQPINPTHQIIYENKEDCIVDVDEKRISHLLSNLLNNAIKYSENADKVVINTSLDKSGITISIRDFGIGIEKKHLNHIFDLFYRANGGNTQKTFGLGLGLFISKAIASAHKGNIWVESDLGEGSTFYVFLPCLK